MHKIIRLKTPEGTQKRPTSRRSFLCMMIFLPRSGRFARGGLAFAQAGAADHLYRMILYKRLLLFNSGPLEGIQPFSKGEILGDLAIVKHETIRKTSANPISCIL